MSIENKNRPKVSMVNRLRKALQDAQTAHGSYGLKYNSAALADNIEGIIVELEDANAAPSDLELSKYHAWLQSVLKALTLTKEADHDMPDEVRALDRIASFFSSFSKVSGYPNICEKDRERWLPIIKTGSQICYENGHRGDSSTLDVEIYDFIKNYRNPTSHPELTGIFEDNAAYLNCLHKANELGYDNVAEALRHTPARQA